MQTHRFLAWFATAVLFGAAAGSARAECSTSIQCIGISANSPQEAEHNHHGQIGGGGTTSGSTLVTMDFSNRPVAGTTTKTLYVAAAQGPTGTVVQLSPIRITGPDAGQFSLVGGTCALNGGNGPTHGANDTGYCTIEVRFAPTSPGVKTALLTVPFPQPNAGFIDHRDATLTGIGGNERVSPALEPQVASLISSQVATLRRFGAAQITNISNRLSSLRLDRGLRSDAKGYADDGLWHPTQATSGAQPVGGPAEFGPLSHLAASLVTSRGIPVMYASESDPNAGAPGGGYWLAGVATFGRAGAASDAARFETTGLTAGADHRFTHDLIVGAAVGYARARNTFGAEGSESNNTGQSVSLYGSYQAAKDVYIDATLGYGTLGSKSSRFESVVNTFARSERDGKQLFGSLAISQQTREENLSWTPYARLDLTSGRLERVDETGAGINSLSYLQQKVSSSRLALGLRTTATHETDIGVVVPHLSIEYGRDLNRVGAASIAYADQPGGTSYSVAPAGESRSHALLGLGAEFLTRQGLVFGFDLSSNGRVNRSSEYATRFWFSTALDDNRPKPPAAGSGTVEVPVTVSAALRLDDNITRTGTPTTPLSDRIWSVGVGRDGKFEFSESMVLTLGALATAEKFRTYTELDNTVFGLRGELAYQAGGHFAAPRFGLFAGLAYDDSRSEIRTGHRIELGINARLQVAERAGLSGVVSHNRRRARGDVFDTDFDAAKGGADLQLGERGTLRVAVEARRGDFVSSGRAMADSAAISEVLVDDDAFASKRFVAYRFPARSTISTIGYSLNLGSRDSFDLSWTGIHVKPTKTPDYSRFPIYPTTGAIGAGGNSPYSVRQIDIAYRMRF